MRKKYAGLVLIGLVTWLSACKPVEPEPSGGTPGSNATTNPNLEVNNWIYDQMKTYYLWTNQMRSKSSTDQRLAPDEYFKSILVEAGTLDRFSWIEKSATELTNSLQGRNTVLGIRSTTFFTDPSQTNVAFAVAYALPGSPADKAGLKRGDFITAVNGVALTQENFSSALAPETVTVTLGEFVNGRIVSTNRTLTITKTEVQTDPVLHASVIDLGTKKVGYLVYLQFLSAYDNKLREVFAQFKAQGVNELVLDLRYNGGGFISSAVTLSSLIVKNLSTNNVMYRDQWNKEITDIYVARNGPNFFTKFFNNEPNNLGTLDRVFVLTSRSTASASELVMNSLLPYMEVIQIGQNTFGKNVGSITIQDETNPKRWQWGMQPIVLKTVNAQDKSEYGTVNGFAPKAENVQADNVLPFQPFGSRNETLLRVALNIIQGGPAAVASSRARIRPDQMLPLATPEYLGDNPMVDMKEMWVTGPGKP